MKQHLKDQDAWVIMGNKFLDDDLHDTVSKELISICQKYSLDLLIPDVKFSLTLNTKLLRTYRSQGVEGVKE